ncbi:hypothetical protein T06_4339, partial [Trichinella sp. T6]
MSNSSTDCTTYKPSLLTSGGELKRNLALIVLRTTSIA